MGTTSSTAKKMIQGSKGSRPATNGNKNITTRAKRQSASAQNAKVSGVIKKNLAGPYLD